MPEYSGSGFLILATGSFFGEIGSDASGEVFMNSHNKSKGIVLDGAEAISSSIDGNLIEHKILNSATGEVLGVRRTEIVDGELKQSYLSGSGAATSNRIQFIQTLSASNNPTALIHISASDGAYAGINIDGATYDRMFRANHDMFVSNTATVFSVGIVSGSTKTGYAIANSIALGSKQRMFIQDDQDGNLIALSGSVSVSGSLKLNGSDVGSGGGGGAIATYNSSGDNRIITSVDSDTVQGESNLTFDGSTLSVNGTLSATRKSFDIQHPSKPNKRLVYGSLEGPEFGVYIRGKVDGDNKIPFPDYWVDLVDMDTLSVHLTPINSEKSIYFTFSDNKYIYINREAEFFYFVCAERKDIDRLQVEQ